MGALHLRVRECTGQKLESAPKAAPPVVDRNPHKLDSELAASLAFAVCLITHRGRR